MGKYKKYTFHDRDNKAHAVLERIYYYVYGHFSTTSTARNKYFVIFIDGFSKKKEETFSKFIKFKALVEKETNKKVKAL